MTAPPAESQTLSSAPPRRRSDGRRTLGVVYRQHRSLTIAALGTVSLFSMVAIFAPLLTRYDPNKISIGQPLESPSMRFWFGTDQLGRDSFSRIVSAARTGMLASVESVGIALCLGLVMGITAGLGSRWVRSAILRLTDLMFAFPEFLLAILVVSGLGPGLFNATLAIGIVYAPRFARVVDGATVKIRDLPYMEAARLSGRGKVWIATKHVLPNIGGQVAVFTALSLSTAQLVYSALSFLGFGARPPSADYGSMLAEAQTYMTTDVWLVLFPAGTLFILVMSFNLLGDLLGDWLDPKSVTTPRKLARARKLHGG